MDFPTVIIRDKNNATKQTTIAPSEIVKDTAGLDIEYMGDVREGSISSGQITLQISADAWERAKALGDELLIFLQNWWGGEIDMQSVSWDTDNQTVTFDAYGWLDYAEKITYLNELQEDPKRWGYDGELLGTVPIFFPNLSGVDWGSSAEERGRIVKIFKNDPYKTSRESPIAGEFEVKKVGHYDGRVGFTLDNLPEAPDVILHGYFDGIKLSDTYNVTPPSYFWRGYVDILKDKNIGLLTDADKGATITIEGSGRSSSTDYDGDYIIYHIENPAGDPTHQRVYFATTYLNSEKSAPSSALPVIVTIKTWRLKGLRFSISPKWGVNRPIEEVMEKCLDQLGVPSTGQHISLDFPEPQAASLSTLARGYYEENYLFGGAAGEQSDIYANPDGIIFFGVKYLKGYKISTGEIKPYVERNDGKGYDYIYDFNEDRGSYANSSDTWQSNSYYSYGSAWEIAKIAYVTRSYVWCVLHNGGYFVIARLNIKDLNDPYVDVTIGDSSGAPIDEATAQEEYQACTWSYWQRSNPTDPDPYLVGIYIDTSGANKIVKWRAANLAMCQWEGSAKTVQILTGAGTITPPGYGICDNYDEVLLASVWGAAFYGIDNEATLTGSSAVLIYQKAVRDYHGIAPAEGESKALLWTGGTVVGSKSKYYYMDYGAATVTQISGERFVGKPVYTSTRPGTAISEKRWWGYRWKEDYKYPDELGLEIVSITLGQSVDDIITAYAIKDILGWCKIGNNLYSGIMLEKEYEDQDDDVGLIQLGEFTMVLRQPNFTDQNLREVLEHLIEMCCAYIYISWDISEAWIYSRWQITNNVYIDTDAIIGTPEYMPYIYSEVDRIDMGDWIYPQPQPYETQNIVTESIYGDYVDTPLLATNIGKNWLDWLNQYIGTLDLQYKLDMNIKTGTKINWNGKDWLVMTTTKNPLNETMTISAIGYRERGGSWT